MRDDRDPCANHTWEPSHQPWLKVLPRELAQTPETHKHHPYSGLDVVSPPCADPSPEMEKIQCRFG